MKIVQYQRNKSQSYERRNQSLWGSTVSMWQDLESLRQTSGHACEDGLALASWAGKAQSNSQTEWKELCAYF